jgi:hypothetical protein
MTGLSKTVVGTFLALTAFTASSAAAPLPGAAARFALPADLQEKVNRAIDRGAAYLKKQLEEYHAGRIDLAEDVGPYQTSLRGYDEGAVALIGLALLEAGVPAQDPVIAKFAAFLRAQAPTMLRTYSLSLAIFFLDRLGDPKDGPLIRSFALRLVANQSSEGSWGYICPILTRKGEEHLLGFLKSVKNHDPEAPDVQKKLPPMSLILAQGGWRVMPSPPLFYSLRYLAVVQGEVLPMSQTDYTLHIGYVGDRSNTQFAMLALWVARRHGLPVDPVLILTARAFRKGQQDAGSWDYLATPGLYPASSTCAGLLSLAVERGLQAKPKDPADDPAIRKAFRYLGGTIGDPNERSEQPDGRRLSWGDLYYFWSIERVAMVYDRETIEGKHWYPWAARTIVDQQNADGSWQGRIETSFALFVLKRANLFKDLTGKIVKPVAEPTVPQEPLEKPVESPKNPIQDSPPSPKKEPDPIPPVQPIPDIPTKDSEVLGPMGTDPNSRLASNTDPVARSTPETPVVDPADLKTVPLSNVDAIEEENTSPHPTHRWPWLVGGAVALLLSVVVLFFWLRSAPAAAAARQQRCARCGQVVQLPESMAGKSYRCPRCGKV